MQVIGTHRGTGQLPEEEDRKEAALGPKLCSKRKQPWTCQITGAQAEKTQRPWGLVGLSLDGGVSCLLPRMEPLGPDSSGGIRGNDEEPLTPSHRDPHVMQYGLRRCKQTLRKHSEAFRGFFFRFPDGIFFIIYSCVCVCVLAHIYVYMCMSI